MQLFSLLGLLITFSPGGVHADSTKVLRLATTTSTENSGLLNYLLPAFELQTGYQLQVIAVGSGAALRMGREEDVNVLLVHAPDARPAS
jgi:tungstate transport system substrate-binding protein